MSGSDDSSDSEPTERCLTVTVKQYTEQQQSDTEDWSHCIITLVGSVDDNQILRLKPPKTGSGTILDLSALEGIEKIDVAFLYDSDINAFQNTTLVAISLGKALDSITSIPASFCYAAASLEKLEIDVDGLLQVTAINDIFLAQCSALRSLDLQPFRNVTTIGRSFLHNCSALESIDLSPFDKVTSISDNFLSKCSSLTTLDLLPLCNVITVDLNWWLDGCDSLRGVIDFTAMRTAEVKVEETGDTFLQLFNSASVVDHHHHQLHIRVPKESSQFVHKAIECNEFKDRFVIEEVE